MFNFSAYFGFIYIAMFSQDPEGNHLMKTMIGKAIDFQPELEFVPLITGKYNSTCFEIKSGFPPIKKYRKILIDRMRFLF